MPDLSAVKTAVDAVAQTMASTCSSVDNCTMTDAENAFRSTFLLSKDLLPIGKLRMELACTLGGVFIIPPEENDNYDALVAWTEIQPWTNDDMREFVSSDEKLIALAVHYRLTSDANQLTEQQ